MVILYNTDNINGLLFLILAKGIKQGLRFDVFFATSAECQDFSRAFWNSSNAQPHGLFEDKFYEMQPILVLTQEQYERETMQKDCAIFVECNNTVPLDAWQKVCFVNVSDSILTAHKEYQKWEYKNGVWKEDK